ncbi:hypothetical protein KBC75_02225 [Candidatus Shapirobacteria bacterium]|nr:hypothetical protein [Candidatus Shapirobacteria bacterium]
MKQKKTILITAVLLLALGAVMWLVKRNQDNRNKAFFAGATMQTLPSSMTARVGEDLTAHVWVNSGSVKVTVTSQPATPTIRVPNCTEECPSADGVLRSCNLTSDGTLQSLCNSASRVASCGGAVFCCPSAGGAWTTNMTAGCTANLPKTPTPITIDGGSAAIQNVKLYMCYDKKISMPVAEMGTRITKNDANGFDSIPLSFVEAGPNGKECLMVTVVADNVSRLKSGNVEVMTVKFKAIATGTGTIDIIPDKSRISGNNTASNDMAISVDGVTGSIFTVTEGTQVPTQPQATNTPVVGATDTPVPTNTRAPTNTMAPTNTRAPTNTLAPTNTRTPTVTTALQPTATDVPPQPTATDVPAIPTEALAQAPYLKFVMSFAGVTTDSACAVDWPLTISVRAGDGTMKTYSNVIPARETGQTLGLQKFRVSLPLEGFNHTSNLAVFVKGPKHLQVKYGRDNQATYYDQAGGEINLIADAASSPVYDFSGYPLLGGDVTGDNNVQDGVVDGRDFSLVKTESLKRTESASGESMLADLNGNCKMESQDVATLMLSLSEKQAQLY